MVELKIRKVLYLGCMIQEIDLAIFEIPEGKVNPVNISRLFD
jgi:hypothetical protein